MTEMGCAQQMWKFLNFAESSDYWEYLLAVCGLGYSVGEREREKWAELSSANFVTFQLSGGANFNYLRL